MTKTYIGTFEDITGFICDYYVFTHGEVLDQDKSFDYGTMINNAIILGYKFVATEDNALAVYR